MKVHSASSLHSTLQYMVYVLTVDDLHEYLDAELFAPGATSLIRAAVETVMDPTCVVLWLDRERMVRGEPFALIGSIESARDALIPLVGAMQGDAMWMFSNDLKTAFNDLEGIASAEPLRIVPASQL